MQGDLDSDEPWLLHRLEADVVTPTTKAADHDVPISPEEIARQGMVAQEDWDTVSSKASPPCTSYLITSLSASSTTGWKRQEEQHSTAVVIPGQQCPLCMVIHQFP